MSSPTEPGSRFLSGKKTKLDISQVTFTPGWEIVNNVVTRAEKSDKQLSRPNTRFEADQQIFSEVSSSNFSEEVIFCHNDQV